jgi:uncharacterized membrane protein
MEQENPTPQPQDQQNVDQPATPPEQMPEGGQPAEQKPAEPQKPLEVPGFLQKKPGQPPVTGEEKLWAIVCYIPFLAIIALIVKPDSKYIKLHGRQGLLLSIMFFISIFIYILPFIGSLIGGFIHLAVFLVGLFSMYQSAIGNWWKIPVLGDLSEMIPADLFSKTAREAIMGPESTIGKEPEVPAGEPAEETTEESEQPQEETPAEEPAKEPETPPEQPAEEPAAPAEKPAEAETPPPAQPAENQQPETEKPSGGEEKA